MEEVLLYYQTDLKSTNVYILDTMHEVYTWVGKRYGFISFFPFLIILIFPFLNHRASESLYKQVLDFANKYVREMALRRKRFIELISVAEGEEAIDFTRHFHTWVTT